MKFKYLRTEFMNLITLSVHYGDQKFIASHGNGQMLRINLQMCKLFIAIQFGKLIPIHAYRCTHKFLMILK